DCCGGGSSRQNLSCSDHDDPGHDHFCGLVWLCDLCGQLQPRRGLFDDHHPSLGAGLWWTVGVGWCSSSAAQSLAWPSRLDRAGPDRYLWCLPCRGPIVSWPVGCVALSWLHPDDDCSRTKRWGSRPSVVSDSVFIQPALSLDRLASLRA